MAGPRNQGKKAGNAPQGRTQSGTQGPAAARPKEMGVHAAAARCSHRRLPLLLQAGQRGLTGTPIAPFARAHGAASLLQCGAQGASPASQSTLRAYPASGLLPCSEACTRGLPGALQAPQTLPRPGGPLPFPRSTAGPLALNIGMSRTGGARVGALRRPARKRTRRHRRPFRLLKPYSRAPHDACMSVHAPPRARESGSPLRAPPATPLGSRPGTTAACWRGTGRRRSAPRSPGRSWRCRRCGCRRAPRSTSPSRPTPPTCPAAQTRARRTAGAHRSRAAPAGCCGSTCSASGTPNLPAGRHNCRRWALTAGGNDQRTRRNLTPKHDANAQPV